MAKKKSKGPPPVAVPFNREPEEGALGIWMTSTERPGEEPRFRMIFYTAEDKEGHPVYVMGKRESLRALEIAGPPEALEAIQRELEKAGIQELWTADLDPERGVVRLTPVTAPEEYVHTMSSAQYHALTEVIANPRKFVSVEGSPWPTALLEKGDAHGRAELRPIEPHVELVLPPEELERLAARMWRQREELSPLDADVLDAVSSEFIRRARRPDQKVPIRIDDILRLRGLKPKKGGSGTRGGYRPEQRAEIVASLSHIGSVWLEITEATVYEHTDSRRRAKPKRLTLRSRAFVMTDDIGQHCLDGTFDVEGVWITPGEAFGRFLFGPGRQVALLSAQALKFNPRTRAPEKALLRYLSWQWRAGKAGAFLRAFRVETLLQEAGIPYEDSARPHRVKARLERALEELLDKGTIAAWQYETGWREDRLSPRGWLPVWLLAKIEIEAPEIIKAAYADIKPLRGRLEEFPPKAETTGEELRRVRRARGFSQLRAAEEIGISQGYVAQIEGGRTPGPKVRRKVERWLRKGLSGPQDGGN